MTMETMFPHNQTTALSLMHFYFCNSQSYTKLYSEVRHTHMCT